MTAKERVDYILKGVEKENLEFLMNICHQTFEPQFKNKAIVEIQFGYNPQVGWNCWVLKEKNTNFQVTCDILHECYECFLRFIFGKCSWNSLVAWLILLRVREYLQDN